MVDDDGRDGVMTIRRVLSIDADPADYLIGANLAFTDKEIDLRG